MLLFLFSFFLFPLKMWRVFHLFSCTYKPYTRQVQSRGQFLRSIHCKSGMFHKPKVVSLSSYHRLPAPPLLSPLFNLFLSCTLTIRCWFAIPSSHLHTQNRTYRYTHCSCWRFCQLFSIFAILSIIVNKLYIFYTFSSPKKKMKQQHARPLEHALVELWWLTSPMPNVNRVCSRPLTKLQTSIPQPLW